MTKINHYYIKKKAYLEHTFNMLEDLMVIELISDHKETYVQYFNQHGLLEHLLSLFGPPVCSICELEL